MGFLDRFRRGPRVVEVSSEEVLSDVDRRQLERHERSRAFRKRRRKEKLRSGLSRGAEITGKVVKATGRLVVKAAKEYNKGSRRRPVRGRSKERPSFGSSGSDIFGSPVMFGKPVFGRAKPKKKRRKRRIKKVVYYG